MKGDQSPEPPSADKRSPRTRGRKLILFLAAGALGVTLFYVIENWRGRRAWERCQQELAAKGEKLDWEAFIPSPVPDDENFYRAPGMTEWFSRKSRQASSEVRIVSLPLWVTNSPLTPAQLRALPDRLTDRVDLATAQLPGVTNTSIALIEADGARSPQVIEAMAKQANLKVTLENTSSWPAEVTAEGTHQWKKQTVMAALADYLWQRGLVSRWDPDQKRVRIGLAGSREELREWFRQQEPEYQMLIQACARPRAQFPGDYSDPLNLELPNFLTARKVAQALATCASLNLFDGRPDAALRNLRVLHRLGEVMGADPTLVGTMMHVGILDLFVDTARGGIESGLWSPSQLEAIQAQAGETNLLGELAHSMRAGERAIMLRALNHKRVFPLLPHGWLLQNEAHLCRMDQEIIEALDVNHQRILSDRLSVIQNELASARGHFTPYNYLMGMLMPDYTQAVASLARAQTELDQLRVACALERYRLGQGEYPEQLKLLVPTYLVSIPGDLFADAPLHYQPLTNGTCHIWSVGWDGKNDDGASTLGTDGKANYGMGIGDWVWVQHAKTPGNN